MHQRDRLKRQRQVSRPKGACPGGIQRDTEAEASLPSVAVEQVA